MKKNIFSSVVDGSEMTWDEVIEQVKENPVFTHPDHVSIIGSDGATWTGDELLKEAGVENEIEKEDQVYGTPDENA